MHDFIQVEVKGHLLMRESWLEGNTWELMWWPCPKCGLRGRSQNFWVIGKRAWVESVRMDGERVIASTAMNVICSLACEDKNRNCVIFKNSWFIHFENTAGRKVSEVGNNLPRELFSGTVIGCFEAFIGNGRPAVRCRPIRHQGGLTLECIGPGHLYREKKTSHFFHFCLKSVCCHFHQKFHYASVSVDASFILTTNKMIKERVWWQSLKTPWGWLHNWSEPICE